VRNEVILRELGLVQVEMILQAIHSIHAYMHFIHAYMQTTQGVQETLFLDPLTCLTAVPLQKVKSAKRWRHKS
jgi:hypothetical protein